MQTLKLTEKAQARNRALRVCNQKCLSNYQLKKYVMKKVTVTTLSYFQIS